MASYILKATPRRLARSLTCCVPSLTAIMLHVKVLREDEFCDAVKFQDRDTVRMKSFILKATLLGGCLEA